MQQETERASFLARLLSPPTLRELLRDPGTALLLATLLVELPTVLARGLLLILARLLLLLLSGLPASAIPFDAITWIVLSVPIWSLLGAAGVWGGGWWWRVQVGGRAPSERERAAYEDAIAALAEAAEDELALPSSWFVVDEELPQACVTGSSLCLSRPLLESESLEAVIAHELGHIRSADGRLTAALNRLILLPGAEREPKPRPFSFIRLLLRLARGGLGIRLLSPLWGNYWRAREYRADAYAVSLGQGDELAAFLQSNALPFDRPVPFLIFTEQTHPPTELRIDRINHLIEERREQEAAA